MMQHLSEQEIAYLESQFLGRLATADDHGQPHVTPVGFRYNRETGTIDIGGRDLESTRKIRDIRKNPRVSFVVDDLESIKPWRPRAVVVRGTAVIYEDENASNGRMFGKTWIRVIPSRVVSWGLEVPAFASR